MWGFASLPSSKHAIHSLMAQLVSKGYAQTYDVDYFETSPIAKLASICFAHLTRCFGEFGIPSNQI